MARRPKVITLLTCVEAVATDRPDLVGVFYSLRAVPDGFWVYIEFRYFHPFTFHIELIHRSTGRQHRTQGNLVLPRASRRAMDLVPVFEGLDEAIPGGYTMVVADSETGRTLAKRDLFFGEM